MKICKDCRKEKNEIDFYGVQGECKECTQKRVQLNYRKNIEYYKEYERKRWLDTGRRNKVAEYQRNGRHRNNKSSVRGITNRAVKKGLIKKLPCEICGDIKSQAHHEDYRRPLKIKWLCFKHHRELHNQIII